MFDSTIKLIKNEYTLNSFGGQVATETEREIFGEVMSVSQSEWMTAGNIGLKPQYKVKTPKWNYEDETLAEYKGKRYRIYRTYIANGIAELYLETQEGAI